MTSVDLFDGQSCCGPASDAGDAARAVARFVVDAQWLESRGVTVRRLSLSSEPAEFVRSQPIMDLLTTGGAGALPALVVDGQLMCSARYADRTELASWCGLALEPEVSGQSPVAPRVGGPRSVETSPRGQC